MDPMLFGILTVSDTCYSGENQDKSGPNLEAAIKEAYPSCTIKFKAIVPDEKDKICQTLTTWTIEGCDVILTTGGTGFSPRDVTPEATKSVIDKEAGGLVHVMTQKSLEVTSMAMLSRSVCGIKDKTLIINLPGSSKGSVECFGFISESLKHAVDLLKDKHTLIKETHLSMTTRSKVQIKAAAARVRKSPYPMIEVSEAVNLIYEALKNFTDEGEIIEIKDSLYRVLQEDIFSSEPFPPFPASTKDGYAVKVADGAGVRNVRDVVAAGDKPYNKELQCGEIIRISTGAAVPDGADAVVQVEDTELVESSKYGLKELKVSINIAPKLGQDIRPIGSDIPANTKLFTKGTVITAAHIGILASIGKTRVNVGRRFSIGIVSTGNELQGISENLKSGHIRDSNKSTLISLLRQYNYNASDCGIAKDDPDDVKRVLIEALNNHDIIITTGGVSMGEFDVVKQVLICDFDATIHFGRINMKPGKPTTFATCNFKGKKKLIFALPGNPVSASVTSLIFVIPALQTKEGFPVSKKMKVLLKNDVVLDPRPEYMRAELVLQDDGRVFAKPTGNQISSRLNSLVGAHVLLVLPELTETRKILEKGTCVEAIKIDPYQF